MQKRKWHTICCRLALLALKKYHKPEGKAVEFRIDKITRDKRAHTRNERLRIENIISARENTDVRPQADLFSSKAKQGLHR